MCSTWVLELLFWVWIWVLPCFELNQCGGGVWVGCSFVRGTEQAQPWLWRWLRCKGATVSLAWPGSTYLWSWVSHISNFLHFMRVCPMFNLDEICFQTLCLNGGHPFILGEGMGNQSDLRICQISDCPHVWNACVVCSNWLEIVSKNCVSVVSTHPIILGKGIGKQSVKNVMNNEGMIVGFSKEIGKQFVSRMWRRMR